MLKGHNIENKTALNSSHFRQVYVQRSEVSSEVKKLNSSPTGHVGPEGSRSVKVPSFRDNGTVMVVGCQPTHLPPLPSGAFLMAGNTPGTHFC